MYVTDAFFASVVKSRLEALSVVYAVVDGRRVYRDQLVSEIIAAYHREDPDFATIKDMIAWVNNWIQQTDDAFFA